MAGGIGPPQDSRRRALVGTGHQESFEGRSLVLRTPLRPSSMMGEPGAASRVEITPRCRGAPLTPRPARGGGGVAKPLDNADAVIDAAFPMEEPQTCQKTAGLRYLNVRDRSGRDARAPGTYCV